MGKIPVMLAQKDFEEHVEPYLSRAERGFVCKIPLYKIFNYILYVLYTGCQWHMLPIDRLPSGKPEITYKGIYYRFSKWCRDGSFEKVRHNSADSIKDILDLSEINIDGTHTIAKKGGSSAVWQGRKKAKTTNILPVTDKKGYPVASTEIIPGNHHDAFDLENNLRNIFKDMKGRKLPVSGAHFNADSAFDTKGARKICFDNKVIPNIAENRRNRKSPRRGRPRLFNEKIYRNRFAGIERTFAWVDKFRRLLVRFERNDKYFYGFHCLAFAMICLRTLIV